MQIRAADCAGENLKQDLSSSRLRDRPIAECERFSRLVKNHRAHEFILAHLRNAVMSDFLQGLGAHIRIYKRRNKYHFCHSERSEESLLLRFSCHQIKERFLASLGMTEQNAFT